MNVILYSYKVHITHENIYRLNIQKNCENDSHMSFLLYNIKLIT